MKYGICLEMIFTDKPFLDRIRLAAEAGLSHAECWFVDGTFNGTDCEGDPKDPDATARAADDAGITLTNTVVGAPDGSLGGGLVDPANREQWLERVKMTLAFNTAAGIPATIVCTGNTVEGMTDEEMTASVVEGLKPTVALAEKEGVTLLLEPLNTRVDHPGYLIKGSEQGAAVCRALGSSRMKLLFDCYHMQIMEGDLVSHIGAASDVIGHFHAAGVPGRNEVYKGEIDYPFLVDRLAATGYTGVFALEYTPSIDPRESLKSSLAYLERETAVPAGGEAAEVIGEGR